MGKIADENIITYEELYPYEQYANFSIRHSEIIKPGETKPEAFSRLLDEMDVLVSMAIGRIKKRREDGLIESPIIPKKNQPQDTEVGLLAAINACTEIKVLETFRLLINKQPQFKEAYDNKMIELTKKQK